MRAALAAVGVLTLAPLAQPACAGPAGAWVVEPSSRLGFRADMSGQAIDGTFRRWNAQIAFDPANLAGSKAVITVEPASAATGDADRDSTLPSTDWFDAAKFPKAVFTAAAFHNLGGGRYAADGVLTLRGVNRPVTLPFTLRIIGDQAVVNGQVLIDRTAFGVGQGQWKSGDVVKAQVAVIVAITAHRAH